jgi:hypothetical protein
MSFSNESLFNQDGINNTRNSHLRSADNYYGTIEITLQHRSSVHVCCGLIGDLLTGTFILLQRLTAANCLTLPDEKIAFFNAGCASEDKVQDYFLALWGSTSTFWLLSNDLHESTLYKSVHYLCWSNTFASEISDPKPVCFVFM